MGIRSLIPGTQAYSRKHHIKFLRKKASGYDALLWVEWGDNKVTFLPANLDPQKGGWYEAANGLYFAPAGEGVDPVQYNGIDVVRCSAEIACPISTTAALQSELEESGDYKIQTDENGHTTKVVRYSEPSGSPDVADVGGDDSDGSVSMDDDDSGPLGPAVSDGGQTIDPADIKQEKKEYDVRPPSPAVGFSFGLEQVKQRAPNAVSANMLRQAVEYGKESERGEDLALKYYLLGAASLLGVIVLLVIIGGLFMNLTGFGGGGGGGGGGGAPASTPTPTRNSTELSLFALFAAPGIIGNKVRNKFQEV